MSVSSSIRGRLKQKVQACSSVQSVYGAVKLNHTGGWPVVFISPGDMDGEFSSTSENSRVYSFRLRIWFPLGQDYPAAAQSPSGEREEYAEDVIATVIDEIINSVDTDFTLSGPDPTVLYVKAADVAWGYADYEGGEARAAELTLRVYTEKTVV